MDTRLLTRRRGFPADDLDQYRAMTRNRSSTDSARGTAAVGALLQTLEHPHKQAILRLRDVILGLDPKIREDVKWNAPSFLLDRHFATFKLHPAKQLQLVLHTDAGSKPPANRLPILDPVGLLKWAAADRCMLAFDSSEAAICHERDIAAIIRQWITHLPD